MRILKILQNWSSVSVFITENWIPFSNRFQYKGSFTKWDLSQKLYERVLCPRVLLNI